MRKIIGIGVFILLSIHLYGQITLHKVPWRGSENKEISLDSILPISAELFFQQILQGVEEKPFYYDVHGRFGKVFLLYDGQLLVENFSRKTDMSEFDKFATNISDKILNAMLPYLSLPKKTIYKLEIFIFIEDMRRCEDNEVEYYFIEYEKEKELFGKKEYNVITVRACQRYPY